MTVELCISLAQLVRVTVTDNPFESFGREFRRAMEEHGQLLNEEMKRVQAQIQSPMEELKAAMGLVGAELQRAMEELHRRHPNPGDSLDAGVGVAPLSRRPGYRPERSGHGASPGTASVPVKPRPKPKPLVDRAEAPIESLTLRQRPGMRRAHGPDLPHAAPGFRLRVPHFQHSMRAPTTAGRHSRSERSNSSMMMPTHRARMAPNTPLAPPANTAAMIVAASAPPETTISRPHCRSDIGESTDQAALRITYAAAETNAARGTDRSSAISLTEQ